MHVDERCKSHNQEAGDPRKGCFLTRRWQRIQNLRRRESISLNTLVTFFCKRYLGARTIYTVRETERTSIINEPAVVLSTGVYVDALGTLVAANRI
jgi:hypothetical protein